MCLYVKHLPLLNQRKLTGSPPSLYEPNFAVTFSGHHQEPSRGTNYTRPEAGRIDSEYMAEASGLKTLIPAPSNSLSDLSAKTQTFDDRVIFVDIAALEVIEKLTTTRDHLEQSAARMVVLFMHFEMLGQLVDPLGQ